MKQRLDTGKDPGRQKKKNTEAQQQ